MATIKSPQLRQLLMQARYAPQKQRLIQLDACQSLIHLITPGKRYPYEFICFHLTGYRPQNDSWQQDDNLLDYNDLIKDIPSYAAQLSRTMRIDAASLKDKIYTVSSLAKRLRVCTKTITRWRTMGLVGRFLVFADGRLRLAFTADSVDNFISKNRDKVTQGTAFSQLSDNARQMVLTRLARWSRHCPNCRQEAIRRTARKFNRSVETIRLILTAAETNGYPQIQFDKRPTGVDDTLKTSILRLYSQGVTVEQLMQQFGRSRSNIYRVVNLAKVAQLLDNKISYIPSAEFIAPGSKDYILTPQEGLFDQADHKYAQASPGRVGDKLTPDSIDSYVNDICSIEVLTARQEQFLFRKYNYLKFQAEQMRCRLDGNLPSGRKLTEIRSCLAQAHEINNILIRSNLRLVISTARKHVHANDKMAEYISEGNLTLMNAVEKFDFSRGFKFSTYATWAIVKRFASLAIRENRQQIPSLTQEELESVEQAQPVDSNHVVAVESARSSLEQVIQQTLDDREQIIVRQHYGLIKQTEITGQKQPRSLSQIAALVGLSKERVRQIELVALGKLRRVLSIEQFDLLTQS